MSCFGLIGENMELSHIHLALQRIFGQQVLVTFFFSISGTQHCTHCSLKFMNGRVYSRDGKTLRPVKIQYPSNSNSNNRAKKKKRKIQRK